MSSSSFFLSHAKKLLAAVISLSLLGAGCSKALDPQTQAAASSKSLSVWGVVDDYAAYAPALDAFQRQYPNVRIDFRRLRLEEYEQALLEGFAEDRGPDVFLIHHDWTNKYLSKIVPQPTSVTMARQVVTGTVQKETTWQLETTPLMTNRQFRDAFIDTMAQDALRTVNISTKPDTTDMRERIMGMPIFVDTLALYYNKDLLNAAGIPTPPETWEQFQDQVKKLTKLDTKGEILQSGAAIGTAYNVDRSVDVLTALMLQSGTEMVTGNGELGLTQIPEKMTNATSPPAYDALRFYTDFADKTKNTYTWNEAQPNSLDAFTQGKTAFFFGYSYQLDLIRARAPKLNFGFTKLPQIGGNPVQNIANYWMWVVAKKSKNPDVAWRLLNFMADPEQSKKILAVMKRPAARKSLLSDQLRDDDIGVFASQALTAKTWYTGSDPKAMEVALQELITNLVQGRMNLDDAVKFAVQKVGQTF